MASRFGNQYPAQPQPGMRPGYMRLGSSTSLVNGAAGPSGQEYGSQMPRQTSSGSITNAGVAGTSSSRRLDRKDTKEVAWVHWRALRDFLAAWGDKESPTARASAREKLTRLTRLQFLELSTDVYDELMRRMAVEHGAPDGAAPFLPVREDFHPKRNQARQKLATLPKNRFKDLASDVFFELRRRYPEFDDMQSPVDVDKQLPTPTYEEPPAPGPIPMGFPSVNTNGSLSSLREGTASPVGQRPVHHRKGSSHSSQGDRQPTVVPNTAAGSRDRFANLTTATNDVVVPNKSRLHEEAIEVPYARDSQEVMGEEAQSLLRNQGHNIGPSGLRGRQDSQSSIQGPPTSNSHDPTSPGAHDDQYFDRMSFASTATRSKAATGIVSPNGWEEQEERIRAEYELRIAGLERRAQMAEQERDQLKSTVSEERERRKDYEDEVRGLKERATTHASSLRSVQHELDLARDAVESVRQQGEQSSRQVQEEIQQWRERCEGLEDELRRLEDERADRATTTARSGGGAGGGGDDSDVAAELQAEVRSLVSELQALSDRNDELVAERERDREAAEALEAKVEEYSRIAKAARTELRNLKATTMLFVSQPLSKDHLPASPDGNIADVHVSAFQSGIDGLLQAARSSQPSGVLPAMKAIVESISNIGEDVKAFEEHPNLDVDVSRLESLKHESTTRLAGLMTAARNHAMASGLSPLSLIDAAAGHLSANVVEIIKLLKIRRSGSTTDILRKHSNMSIGDMVRRRSQVFTKAETSEVPSPVESERLEERPRENGSALAYRQAPRPSPPRASPSRGNLAAAPPPSAYDGAPEFRIKSFQSASSTAQRSDSFDLERKGSIASAGSDYEPRERGSDASELYSGSDPFARAGSSSTTPIPTVNVAGSPETKLRDVRDASETRAPGLMPATPPVATSRIPTSESAKTFSGYDSQSPAQANDQEWNDLKPYLDGQSTQLVNSIQNLLASIRTGGQGPALNEHLSEVIAVSTSIVAVCRSALPARLRAAGDPLLADLVGNTDRLSEAQQAASRAGGFDKALRQGIASASFGVAKALKALMKVGTEGAY